MRNAIASEESPSRLSWQTGFQSANRTDSSCGEPVESF